MSEKVSDAIAALLDAPAVSAPEGLGAAMMALVPAVPIAVGQKMLGDKARSEMYRAQAEGILEFLKDGGKTLVTVKSILAYQKKHFKPFATAKLKAAPGPKRRRRKSGAQPVAA